MAGSEEGHVCFSVSKDCLADVTADGGGQERRTGACGKVVSPAHLEGEPPLSGRLHRVTFWKAAFFKLKLSRVCSNSRMDRVLGRGERLWKCGVEYMFRR